MNEEKNISSKDDYHDTINAHKNNYIISTCSFIISLISGVVAIGAVYFGYTKYEIVNWVILILLFIVSFFSFILFFFAQNQAGAYEKKIAEYQRINGLSRNERSVKSFIIRSYFSIFAIAILTYILHSMYVL